jgi:ParB-like chromosome segregation protein Spo0J
MDRQNYDKAIAKYTEEDTIRIVDGFHRRKSERTNAEIHESTLGYIPVSTIRDSKRGISDRMASTIRHNRARGTHNIDLMVNIVAELTEAGMGSDWIMKHIGMDADELLRLKQISGLAALFKNRPYSRAWE